MAKSLLLISIKNEDLIFSQEAALQAGLELKCVKTFEEGAETITKEDVAIIFADVSSAEQYQAFESSIEKSIGLFSDKINSNAIHFLSSEDLSNVQYLIQSPLFGHYVMRNYTEPKDAGRHYGYILRATLAERAFGLTKLLKEGSKVQVIQMNLSTRKHDVVEAVKGYLMAAKFQSRMATVIANAVDELMMNAIFDAPIDDIGKPLMSTTPRSTSIKLEGKNAVELHIGFDGQYVAISAIDLYGSLDKVKLLSHISKIYVKEEYKVRMAVAGAGIGLATVFRSGGSFFFVSESGVKTEVTVFFKRTDNFREFKDQFRFISTQFYF